jgi:hypothetical protein
MFDGVPGQDPDPRISWPGRATPQAATIPGHLTQGTTSTDRNVASPLVSDVQPALPF